MDDFEKDDVLSTLINTLKKQNEHIESMSESIKEIAVQRYYENVGINGHSKISEVDKKSHTYNPIPSHDIGKSLTYPQSEYPYQNDNLEKFEKYIETVSRIWVAASKSMETLQKSFDKLGKSVSGVDESLQTKKKGKKLTFNESQSLLEKKGFKAAIRRGIIDTGELSTQRGVKESIGRSIGKGLSYMGSVPMSHRKAYAREFLYPEQEFKRAISSTEAERNELLPHEIERIDDRRRKIKKGEIDTGALTEDQDIEKFKKKIVAQANLKAVRKKDVNYRPDLQKQWLVDSGELELYNSKKVINRAKSQDKEAQLRITKEEKLEKILPLAKKLKEGRINTYGIPHEVFKKQEEQLTVLRNNLSALEHNAPEIGNEDGGLREQYRNKIEKLNNARERAKNEYHGYNKKIENTPQVHQFSTITHSTQINESKNKQNTKGVTNDNNRPPIVGGLTSFVSPKEFKASSLKADKLEVKELGVTTLNVSALNAQNLASTVGGSSGEDSGGFSLSGAVFGAGKGSIRSRVSSMIGKAPNFGKSMLKMAGRGVVGAFADSALGEVAGVGKDEFGNDLKPDTFQDDINWNNMTTGQKVMSSIPRGIESIGNLVGLSNMATQAKSDRISKETEMYSPKMTTIGELKSDGITPNAQITPKSELIRGEFIKPILDQKQAELSNAKNENDQLVQREREIYETRKASPVILNNQTNNVTQKQSPIQNSIVRSSFNAYERFVNRTFVPL